MQRQRQKVFFVQFETKLANDLSSLLTDYSLTLFPHGLLANAREPFEGGIKVFKS